MFRRFSRLSLQQILNTINTWKIKQFNPQFHKRMLTQLFGNEVKNMTDTLSDGKAITIQSEDGDWVGKKVTLEDGSPLPAGEHTLASGRKIIRWTKPELLQQ